MVTSIDNIRSILTDLDAAICRQQTLIPINAVIAPTKGPRGLCQGFFYRDQQIENAVKDWIEERTSFKTLMDRYKDYDATSQMITWPKHLPVRLFNIKGVLTEGRNIFLVFPLALGWHHAQFDCFGFELIDVWENVFKQIISPCANRIFSKSSLQSFNALMPAISKISYLAAVFHEIGHKVGNWKIFPCLDERIKLPSFYINAICELEADILMCLFLQEFPELPYFILLQRIFWFGRLGFSAQQLNGDIRADHDAWIGSFLWIKSVASGLIKEIHGKVHICLEHAENTFQNILNELVVLKKILIRSSTQQAIAHTWMQSAFQQETKTALELTISRFPLGGFTMPESLRTLFLTCLDIPNYPNLKERICIPA